MSVQRTPGPGSKILDEALKKMVGKVGKVGWFPSAKYEDGTPVAYVAAIQEFGSTVRGIPARPFMRPTITNKKNVWKDIAAREAKNIIKGEGNANDLMEKVGAKAAGDIRKTISEVTTPPLSHTTILLRKLKKEGGTVTAKAVGDAFKVANFVGPRPKKDKSNNVAGVSIKPLVDSKIMINTLTNSVEDK